jgi:hypothetical protein
MSHDTEGLDDDNTRGETISCLIEAEKKLELMRASPGSHGSSL